MNGEGKRRGSLTSAMNWMAGLSLLLFWLPGLGPFIAGLVGGSKAGSVRRAVLAVFLPAVLTGVLAAAGVVYLAHWWVWGLLAGLGGIAVSLLNVVPLLGGAVLGGLVSRLTLGDADETRSSHRP
ncbi:MAG: hypothetical protein ACJ8DC_12965 [Gemmatimonadales bacterium]